MIASSRKSHAASVSVASNTILVILKLIVGVISGSVSVISEAIHSGIDLIAAAIALFAVRGAAKPADREHPFGHGKLENLSGTIEALLIFVAAIWIIAEAVHKLRNPAPLEAPGLGSLVMLVSAVTNFFISRYLFREAKETSSIALEADAWHLRTDVWTSVGVMAALGVISLGSWLFPLLNISWIDPVAALCVALLILRAAWQLTRDAGQDLLDRALPPNEIESLHSTILDTCPTACSVHKVRTRRSGSQRFVELHLVLDPSLSVLESHRITDSISVAIRERLSDCSATIHVEPCDRACSPSCKEGCLVPDLQGPPPATTP